MEETARIRINLSVREIELEGSEKFIDKYTDMIQEYLRVIRESSAAPSTPSGPGPETTLNGHDERGVIFSAESLPSSFGEYYSRFPKSIKDVDRILLAGFFFQQQNGNSPFSNQDAATLLLEQNVKLSNTSVFLKGNLEARKIFKHEGKYRVSELGVEHIKKLLAG